MTDRDKSAGTKAMDEIKDSLFGGQRRLVNILAPITDADIQNAEAVQDEMCYSEVAGDEPGQLTDSEIIRAAAHVLRMAKETGPTKMTTVLYLDQYAEELEKAEEEA